MKPTPKTDELIRMISDIESFLLLLNIPLKTKKQFESLSEKTEYYIILTNYRLLGYRNIEYKGEASFKKFRGEVMPENFTGFVKKHIPMYDNNILEQVLKDYDEVTTEDLKQEFWSLITSKDEIENCISLIKIKFDEVLQNIPDSNYYDYIALIKNKDIISRYEIIERSEVEKFLLKISIIVEHLNMVRNRIIETYERFSIKTKTISSLHESFKNELLTDERLTAKHYVLAYVFDCNSIGESLPHGSKKELERIGNERMGSGKGNTFYKNYNLVINKDLNAKKTLIDEMGENWRKILLHLSYNSELLEAYLQSKHL